MAIFFFVLHSRTTSAFSGSLITAYIPNGEDASCLLVAVRRLIEAFLFANT
jgi:hypothetical protein